MRQNLPSYQSGQRPIVLLNRAPFIRGFLLGSVVAMGAYVALYLCVWQESPSLDRISIAEAIDAGIGEQASLAIARAEEINRAVSDYVASCGRELAGLAWSEAGAADERYQLLSSFIPSGGHGRIVSLSNLPHGNTFLHRQRVGIEPDQLLLRLHEDSIAFRIVISRHIEGNRQAR